MLTWSDGSDSPVTPPSIPEYATGRTFSTEIILQIAHLGPAPGASAQPHTLELAFQRTVARILNAMLPPRMALGSSDITITQVVLAGL